MLKSEKLSILKEKHFSLFMRTRAQVFNELSDNQTLFCCCGRLATGLHETHCRKFNDKVTSQTIERLSYLFKK